MYRELINITQVITNLIYEEIFFKTLKLFISDFETLLIAVLLVISN